MKSCGIPSCERYSYQTALRIPETHDMREHKKSPLENLKEAVREDMRNGTPQTLSRVQGALDSLAHYHREPFRRRIKRIKDAA